MKAFFVYTAALKQTCSAVVLTGYMRVGLIIHTTQLETALQRSQSVSIVTARSHHAGTAQLVVHAGREPALTVSQRLRTFEFTYMLTARPWMVPAL